MRSYLLYTNAGAPSPSRQVLTLTSNHLLCFLLSPPPSISFKSIPNSILLLLLHQHTLSDNYISFCISTRMFSLKYSVFCLLAASSVAFLASTESKQVDFPLPDSLPNPSPSQIESIQMRAGGTLPNTPPPMRISSEGINNLKLMAFTGLSEVAFFDELLRNITTNVQGYQVANAQERDMVIKSLTTFLAVCASLELGERPLVLIVAASGTADDRGKQWPSSFQPQHCPALSL